MTTEATPIKPWHVVRRSKLHGNGVFAARKIPAGTRIIEYGGARISAKEADRRHPTNPDDPFHTFFFALSSGRVIDGGDEGNDARWINHSCQPNCEAQEGKHGKRVYIVALQDIPRGTELSYDYGLVLDGRITKALKEGYRCLCGTPPCRGTMLALPKKKTKKSKSADAAPVEDAPVEATVQAPVEAAVQAAPSRTTGRKTAKTATSAKPLTSSKPTKTASAKKPASAPKPAKSDKTVP
ncbi:MAG: SET domain-containing protein-lysine N-methyltransferase [Achromobacter sp.]|nr:SET domain-containing protein-lysine N-methyltransferase [Achromobacter sp.]